MGSKYLLYNWHLDSTVIRAEELVFEPTIVYKVNKLQRLFIAEAAIIALTLMQNLLARREIPQTNSENQPPFTRLGCLEPYLS